MARRSGYHTWRVVSYSPLCFSPPNCFTLTQKTRKKIGSRVVVWKTDAVGGSRCWCTIVEQKSGCCHNKKSNMMLHLFCLKFTRMFDFCSKWHESWQSWASWLLRCDLSRSWPHLHPLQIIWQICARPDSMPVQPIAMHFCMHYFRLLARSIADTALRRIALRFLTVSSLGLTI